MLFMVVFLIYSCYIVLWLGIAEYFACGYPLVIFAGANASVENFDAPRALDLVFDFTRRRFGRPTGDNLLRLSTGDAVDAHHHLHLCLLEGIDFNFCRAPPLLSGILGCTPLADVLHDFGSPRTPLVLVFHTPPL